MNRFVKHAIIYEGSNQDNDRFRFEVCDSVRIDGDTLYALFGPEAYKAQIDSLIFPGEHTVIINKQVWQPIALHRLYRIKSKRQPLSKITVALCAISLAAFVGGAIMIDRADDNTVENKWGGVLAAAGDLGYIITYSLNTGVAKKRFIFRKYKWKQRPSPLILL